MEKHQREHILKHLPDLVELTECNTLFLSYLVANNILGVNDVADLEATPNKYKKNNRLYEIMMTRLNSYEILLQALEKTHQSGTLAILKNLQHPGASLMFHPEKLNLSVEDSGNTELSQSLFSKGLRSALQSGMSSYFDSKPQHFDTQELKNTEYEKQRKLEKWETEIQTAVKIASMKWQTGGFLESDMDYIVKQNLRDYSRNPPKPLPRPPPYYIKRRLKSRYNLLNEVLYSSSNDVFLVEGVQKHELTSLAEWYKTDTSGNQIDSLTVRHILLECDYDYERIGGVSSEPVHWIKYTNKRLHFVKSTKSVSVLQKYIHGTQELLTEAELLSHSGKVVIISGSPGVGKTMLLYSIAQQKLHLDPDMLVLYVIMKELVHDLHKKEVSRISVIKAIAKHSSKFELEETQVKSRLISGTYTLLLDGFDEVFHHQVNTAKQILQTLLTLKLPSLFVTTRPHMLEDLEDNLETLGFTLELFTVMEQRDFFLRVWEAEGAVKNNSTINLARSCLRTLSFKMKDFEEDIAGVPLQCKILAEIYKDKAIRCNTVKFEDAAAPASYTSVYEMYKRHIAIRISEKDKRYKSVIRTHMRYALQLLFPDLHQEFQEILPKIHPPVLESHLLRLGILEKDGSAVFRFVHRTFAEYFVAWFAFDKTCSEPHRYFILAYLLSTAEMKATIKTPLGKLVTKNLFCFNFPVICYFMNGFIKDQMPEAVNPKNVCLMLASIDYDWISPALIASAYHNYTYLPHAVAYFLSRNKPTLLQTFHNPTMDIIRKVTTEATTATDFTDLLIATTMYADVEMLELFCTVTDIRQTFLTASSASLLITPLHIAVQRGEYKLVEFLVSKYKSVLTTLNFLIHFCVVDSQDDSSTTVDDKKQIIYLLSSKSKQWIVEPLEDGTIPLQQKNAHSELLECLKQEIENCSV